MEDDAPLTRVRLSKAARQERIVAELRATPTLRVSELAEDLSVSTETIRRDLDELEARGLINRTYGGAVRGFEPEPAIAERHRLMVAERESIAATTARHVAHADALLIGGGATTTHVARRLAAERKDLVVITHSFGVATVLAANPTITVIMCPGRYNGREGCVFGAETLDYLRGFHANHAILGATGLTVDGPNDADVDAAAVYHAMVDRAAEVTIVADHTKFDRTALSIYAGWSQISRLVTDAPPEGPLARALDRARVTIDIANRR
jgi:DeoR/GlpR family transcriptional regulator of sugar metabolism